MENTAFPGPGGERLAGSIGEQIMAIDAELAAEAGGTVTDLSNSAEPEEPAIRRPSLPRGWRRRRYPVLIGWPGRGGKTLEVWCPVCQVFHVHARGPGHRAAHCTDGPFKRGGYVIVEVRP